MGGGGEAQLGTLWRPTKMITWFINTFLYHCSCRYHYKYQCQYYKRYHQTRLDLSVQVDTEDSEPRVRILSAYEQFFFYLKSLCYINKKKWDNDNTATISKGLWSPLPTCGCLPHNPALVASLQDRTAPASPQQVFNHSEFSRSF